MIAVTSGYTMEQYQKDVSVHSLREVWDAILLFVKTYGETDFLKTDQFGDLYELGLSLKDKISKKNNGVYYTPKDVSDLLADYFLPFLSDDGAVCDVCCGVGNLILSVLDKMPDKMRDQYLSTGRIWLYDIDDVALDIAVARIGFRYGTSYQNGLNIVRGDFLSSSVSLPKGCHVISNPPYARIKDPLDRWEKTKVLSETKEYYAVFMEKCILQAKDCVFITPFSFVGGRKFYALRRLLNNAESKIFVFDNVPGNIFSGRKHGVFNSNTINSTRVAVSCIRTRAKKGACVSPMIRFSSAERSSVLSKDVLDRLLNEDYYQVVSDENRMYFKCFPEDIASFLAWKSLTGRFGSLTCSEHTSYHLDVPKACRYFTSASFRTLQRDGKTRLYFKDADRMNYAYVLLNSSFAYWYWRVYDGAIMYPLSLMDSMPVNYDTLTKGQKADIRDVCLRFSSLEKDRLIYKKNADKIQENIKFSDEEREVLNELMGRILGVDGVDFSRIHSPVFFKGGENNGTDMS